MSDLELRDRVEKSIELIRTGNLEDFVFDWVCVTEERLAEIQYDDEDKIAIVASKRTASLRGSDLQVYRTAVGKYPLVEYATNSVYASPPNLRRGR